MNSKVFFILLAMIEEKNLYVELSNVRGLQFLKDFSLSQFWVYK